jgi:hypothetical protein
LRIGSLRFKGIYTFFHSSKKIHDVLHSLTVFFYVLWDRFTPTLPVLLYHGTGPERAALRQSRMSYLNKSFPIIVTSYEIVMNDRKYLQVSFFYIYKFFYKNSVCTNQ